MPTPRQNAVLDSHKRHGTAARFIPDAANTGGLEAENTGNEAGAFTIYGVFKDKTYPFPASEIDNLRSADEASAPHREWTFTCAAASFTSEPSINDHLVHEETTYLVLRVRPRRYQGVPVEYTLVVRPL